MVSGNALLIYGDEIIRQLADITFVNFSSVPENIADIIDNLALNYHLLS
jgi:hypothetical protein